MATRYEQLADTLRHETHRWVVTGAAGFIGSHLVSRLLELGQQVIAIDNFATGKRENVARLTALATEKSAAGDSFSFHEVDCNESEKIKTLCAGAHYLLHQAALGSVPRSIAHPQASHHANVSGFLSVLLAAHASGIKRLVYASSSSVYGDSEKLPKVEGEIGAPLSPYALTKRVNEEYAALWSKVYGVSSVGLRYFNVFGPHQDPEGAYAAVIPKWIAATLRGEPCAIYGDGETSRDFCFVENVVQANLLAALSEYPFSGEALNIACGERTTLNDLCAMIAVEAKCSGAITTILPPTYGPFRGGDVRHSLADYSRAKTTIGYTPVVSVAEGVKRTVAGFVR